MANKKTKETKTQNTKTPTDLKITINSQANNVDARLRLLQFTAEWNIASANHGGGQKMFYQRGNDVKKPSWTGKKAPQINNVSLNTTQTSKVFIERNFDQFYPASGKSALRWLHVEVIGKRQTRKETTSKKETTYKYRWSNPAARTLHIIAPPEADLADEVGAGSSDFEKVFSWTVPASSTWIGKDYAEKVKTKKEKKKKKKIYRTRKWAKRFAVLANYGKDEELAEIFYDTEWQTILIDNLNPPKNFDPDDDTFWTADNAHCSQFSGTTAPGQESGLSATVTETNSSWIDNYSYTRYFRVRSRGPGGASHWDYDEFIYYNAESPAAPSSANMDADGNITMTDASTDSTIYPAKYISYQYLTDVPETSIAQNGEWYKVSISPPSGSTSWVEAIKVPVGTAVSFPTDKPVNDKLTWVRKVFVGQDNSQRNGEPLRVSSAAGLLTPPTGINISNIDISQKRMTVSATNNSQVPSSFLVVYCRNAAGKETAVGVIPHGETGGVTIQLPSDYTIEGTDIGVKAVLGDYKFNSSNNTYTLGTIYMASASVWDGGTLPSPPTGLKLETTDTMGTIRATWNWTWVDSNVAEISWSENKEAWESTSPPSTYTIDNTHMGKWYISGLSVGTWYVKVRLGRTENDVTTWSTYGETEGNQPIKIVSVPDRPYLMVTPKVITPDKEVKLSWVYSSEDGAPLSKVYIARSGYLNSPIVSTNQSTITLSRSDFQKVNVPWGNNDTISLRIRTESSETKQSEWSTVGEDSTFQTAPLPMRPTITFNSGWNPSKSVTIDTVTRTEPCLVSLPLTFTLSGFDKDNYITAKILRQKEDTIMLPDENEYPVYADDVIFLNTELTQPGQITVNYKDLIGTLDDRAYYRLIISNTDKYGQSPAAGDLDIPFRVDWNHKAVDPSANITIDRDNDVAFIRTIQPPAGDYLAGDTCDIYRLSVDKPELIISDAAFGTWYADEYPTIGEFGGYKVVYRTFNGDSRTIDGRYAHTEYEGEDYSLTDFMSIIDFGKDSVTLRYNLSLSNSWNKDFTETKYLGGAVQGDWNPAVSRTGSIKATVSIKEDPMTENPEETIEAMRRLAVYAGVCHVRTPDGSNYYANVDVQEDREEKWVTQLAKFSLNITRVDPPEVKYTMRTKAEWEEDQEDEE